MKVANRRTVRRLAFRSLRAGKTRNLVAVLAIILTSLLFTALFTVAETMNYSVEQQSMRQVGGYSHGGFKELTREQVNELKDDPLIREYGTTFLFAKPEEAPFDKIWLEIRYADENYAKFGWSQPTTGRMPEKEKEAAVDTAVLEELGVPKELGAEVTVTYPLGKETVTDTFTLCGFWEADQAAQAHMMWLSEEYVLEKMEKVPREDIYYSGIGSWFLDVMFKDSKKIEENLDQVAENHGYTTLDADAGNYLSTGVNWAYTSTRSDTGDIQDRFIMILALVSIILAGYLIIYNVFQISVAGDVRFYGLLKTIGTTRGQIRRMLFWQAALLSGIGIPVGLLAGYAVGNLLAPVMIRNFDDVEVFYTANPLIFVGSALFALVTVLISCLIPAWKAGKVSPIEAVRYTEQSQKRSKKKRKSKKRSRIYQMAMGSLMRNKLKTVLVVLSLSLSLTILNGVYIFSVGFNMDGFLDKFVLSDFLVGTVDYFNYSGGGDVSDSLVENLNAQPGMEDGGYVYYAREYLEMDVTKEQWIKQRAGYSREHLDPSILALPDDAAVSEYPNLFGLDDFPFTYLEEVEGHLEDWKNPDSIIHVIQEDDYGRPRTENILFHPGEQVKLTYSDDYTWNEEGTEVTLHGKTEKTYTVAAVAVMPGNMTLRRYGNPMFAMSAEGIQSLAGKNAGKMIYMADFTEESQADAEQFLKNYTENVETDMQYESKAGYASNFQQIQTMIWVVGGSMSLLIGLVGILNFANGEVTSIVSRKRELAMLQSIGMTGKQMKKMLIMEGILIGGSTIILALILNFGIYFGLLPVVESLYWFFKRKMTVTMILIAVPVLALLGVSIPILVYKAVSRKSIVDRLREHET
ncbi:ABC transporter permease [Luxibacter massiliensis]|uniref:ABC transporter permease n=1 Tax=Luxibacter massiliensis TaxID=2219695 RepID=UPI000F046E2A|nr:FtsX-like permease family protein [Luxibacter massiliensis]